MAAAQRSNSACVIKLDGSDLSAGLMEALLEVKVQENVMLPATATVRLVASDFEDPAGAVDSSSLKIGKSLQILTGDDGGSTRSIFKGVIVSEEAEFKEGHAEVFVRAYDRSHRLNRERKNRTFQDMTATDIVKKIAGDHGLAPTVQTGKSFRPFKHIEQSGQTDWELCWRFAQMYDMELQAEDSKLVFRDSDTAVGDQLTLRYTEALLSFRPRVTGAGTVEKVTIRGWDPKTKAAVVGNATKSPRSLRGNPPASDGNLARDTGATSNGTLVSDLGPMDQAEANAVAKSMVGRLAGSAVEAEGNAVGNPNLRAGTKVQIEGVGTRFSGVYRLSAVTHVYRASGYFTQFAISGSAARGLLDLLRPKPRRDWGNQLVIGIVTNNSGDPDKMGRVKVKVPALSDSDETWWARVVSPSAGSGHGIFSLPAVDDEVILGFENGDTRRPYVLGSLFNGRDKPTDDAIKGQPAGKHGNYVANSGEKYLVSAKKELELKAEKPMLLEGKDTLKIHSDKAMTIEVSSGADMTLDGGSNIKVKSGQGFNLEAGTSVTVKGSVNVNVEAGASKVALGPSGVQISGAMIQLG